MQARLPTKIWSLGPLVWDGCGRRRGIGVCLMDPVRGTLCIQDQIGELRSGWDQDQVGVWEQGAKREQGALGWFSSNLLGIF